jgi:hypothetical protein
MADDWVGATTAGSAYEVEFSPSTGKWRHRLISTARLEGRASNRITGDETTVTADWTRGTPPDMEK